MKASTLRIAAIAAIACLQLVWIREPWPYSIKLLPFALAALSLWRPWAGLIGFAALAPFKGEISEGTRLLEQLALAVLLGAAVRWTSTTPRLRLARPALILGSIAMASAFVVLPARIFAAGPDTTLIEWLSRLWNGADFTTLPEWRPLVFALYAVEGLALACVAERAVRDVPSRAWQLLGVSVGAHAVVALTSVVGVVRTAAITGEWQSLASTLRIDQLTDPNAMGSVFVFTSLALGAFFRRPLARVALASVALIVTLAALYLTGSRTALIALGLTAVVLAVVRLAPAARRPRRLWFASAATIFLIGTGIFLSHPSTLGRSMSFIGPSRWIVARAGLRMVQSAPLFGVGVGTFWDRSVEFGTEDIIPIAHAHNVRLTDAHENAHNNFIQVLAEEGTVGLIAFVLLLTSVLAPAAARLRRGDPTTWLFAGIAGFMLTWLAGHPLLVPEAAFVFWMFFGVLAGLTPAPPQADRSRWVWLVVAALAVSIPFRVVADGKVADFSHVGVGVSEWATDTSGIEYRTAGSTFSLYIPANRLVVVPIRRAPGAQPPLHIEVRAEDRLVNALVLEGTDWSELPLTLPSKHNRFLRVDVTIRADPAQTLPATLVQLGKDKSR